MGGQLFVVRRRKDNEKYVFLQDLDEQYMQVFQTQRDRVRDGSESTS